MSISAQAALWFLPFVAPLCLYTCYTDLSRMKITNGANLLLAGVFLVVGLIALPFDQYLWRIAGMLYCPGVPFRSAICSNKATFFSEAAAFALARETAKIAFAPN